MSEQRVVVMGLGNLLWADEGFGVRVAERLYAHYHWPEDVEIVDGGTQGLNLLGYVESASHLLILDAIDYGLEPGTLRTYAGERIPAYLSAKKMSRGSNCPPRNRRRWYSWRPGELYRNRLRSCAVSIMTVCRWKITKAFACVSTR